MKWIFYMKILLISLTSCYYVTSCQSTRYTAGRARQQGWWTTELHLEHSREICESMKLLRKTVGYGTIVTGLTGITVGFVYGPEELKRRITSNGLVRIARAARTVGYHHNCDEHTHLHLFVCSSNIWYWCIGSQLFLNDEFITKQQNDRLLVSLFVQSVEYCTGSAEVMGSTSYNASLDFFRPYFHHCLMR